MEEDDVGIAYSQQAPHLLGICWLLVWTYHRVAGGNGWYTSSDTETDHAPPSRWATELGNGRAYGVVKPRRFLGKSLYMAGFMAIHVKLIQRYAGFMASLV